MAYPAFSTFIANQVYLTETRGIRATVIAGSAIYVVFALFILSKGLPAFLWVTVLLFPVPVTGWIVWFTRRTEPPEMFKVETEGLTLKFRRNPKGPHIRTGWESVIRVVPPQQGAHGYILSVLPPGMGQAKRVRRWDGVEVCLSEREVAIDLPSVLWPAVEPWLAPEAKVLVRQ